VIAEDFATLAIGPLDIEELFIQMKLTRALVLSLALGFALSAVAQTPSVPAGPAKIAVIAFQATVGQTNEGQRNFADLQKKYEPKREQLKALSDEIDKLTKQLQTQADALGDAERANRAKTIDEKKKQLDRSSEDARADYQGEVQELYTALASKVYDVLSGYAQQQGYTLVLDIGQQQSPVLFANPTTDITKAVLDAYNVKSGVPAPAGQPAATAPTPSTSH
jgi:outer membrane protein